MPMRYVDWREYALAEFCRRGGLPYSVPERVWRQSFIIGATVEQAADSAERHAHNRKVESDRRRCRMARNRFGN